MLLKIIPDNLDIDFMGMRRVTVPISLIGMLGSVILVLVIGLNLGVDFRGGSMLLVEAPEQRPIGDFRDALTGAGIGEATVTESRPAEAGASVSQVVVRLPQDSEDDAAQAAVIETARAALQAAVPGLTVLSVESIGSKVSGELIRNGAIAVILSVLLVQLYIWARFEWQFAVAAGFALIHDVTLTIGIFSLLQFEFNLSIVAALLTIVGYSLNDTVVVFDRVRENLRKFKKMPLPDIMNRSTNDTMSRTILTAGTTVIALIALLIFGGEVIRGFTFAMLWGVFVGTYSSVFVAQVIVNWFGIDRSDKPDAKAGTQFANIDA